MSEKTKGLTRKDLYDAVWAEPVSRLALKCGITDVGLAKICRRSNIPLPPRGYWQRKAAGKAAPQKPPLPAIPNRHRPDAILLTMRLEEDGQAPEPERPKIHVAQNVDVLALHPQVFTGARSNEEDRLPGNFRINDWRRWIPLIGLFTGARLGEIAQLYVADVRQQDGQWIFHITRETARDGDVKKTTKTKGSQRVVPVHSELIKCGFLDYLADVTKRGEKRLFPEIKPDARGQMSGYPSRWYGRYVAHIGVKDDNFHSFRHGLMDALRRAGYLDDQFKFLVGHTGATVTGRYGILPEGELKMRVAMMEAVSFPGLDLSHLYPLNA